MPPRITAIAAQKGGATKTAVACNVGPMLALAGRRTLMIDLDQQADLTARFGFTPETLDYSMVDVLAPRNSIGIDQAIVRNVTGISGLDLLASDIRASGLEEQLTSVSFREALLGRQIAGIADHYDEIVIDCPPSLGVLTMNGLVAAGQAIVPVNMQDRAALNGVEQLLETILTIQEQTPNDAVRLRALVRNRVTEGAVAYRRNAVKLDALEAQGIPVATTMLKEARAWHNAGAEDLPLVMHAPNSDASRNFRDLMVELWSDVQFPYMSDGARVLRSWRRVAA
jgi:chromosome partitioning protein